MTKGMRAGNYTECAVVSSNYFAEIQTNDFITGAVGRYVNDKDENEKIIFKLDKKPTKIKISSRPGKTNPNLELEAMVLKNCRSRGSPHNRADTPDNYTSGSPHNRADTPSVMSSSSRLNKKILHRKTGGKPSR